MSASSTRGSTGRGTSQAPLPRVNTPVLLSLPDVDHDLPSRVEDRYDDLVVVAVVAVPGRSRRGSDGEVLTLAWATPPRGLLAVACILVEQRLVSPPLWLLRPFGPRSRLQRRRYARADVTVRAMVSGGEPAWRIAGQVSDLSEGGARIMLEAASAPPAGAGDLVWLDLGLPEEPVHTVATLLGVDLLGGGRRQVRLQFDLHERPGERVRRAVLKRQLEGRGGDDR